MTAARKLATLAKFVAIAGLIVVAFLVLLVAVLAVKTWSWVRG